MKNDEESKYIIVTTGLKALSHKKMFADYDRFRATRILNADFINLYKPLMSFFLYISCYSVYFYSNLYYKHK